MVAHVAQGSAPAEWKQAAVELRALLRDAKRTREHLATLTGAVLAHLGRLDVEMALPSTPERGKRIAALSNTLDQANDAARYFGLGIDHRTDNKAALFAAWMNGDGCVAAATRRAAGDHS